MKVSIKQISRITGFSPATVSNALNRKKGVNRETSDKIFRVAEQLGYQTDKMINKIRFIIYRKNGLIIDESQIFSAMIEGVERQAKELGYETAFIRLDCTEDNFAERLEEVLGDTESLMILLGTEMLEEDYVPFQKYKGHMILLDGWSESMLFDAVLINNTDAACEAIDYLVARGHREIGYLRGDYRIKAFCYREYGYERTLGRYGLGKRPEHIVTVGTQLESSYEGMKRYLEKKPHLPTAFFADNDVIALGAMRAMREEGIQVPGDVSVIGFDDISFGAVSTPELTTLHVYKQEMGEIAVRRLLDNIRRPERDVKVKIQVCATFTERGSVSSLNNN